MRDDNWRLESPLPRAVPKLPGCSAKGYSSPEVKTVAVSIESDEEEFMPRPCGSDGGCAIRSNIPSGSLVMSEGATAVIDCGFSMALPQGYRCRMSSSISGLALESVDSKRFKVNAINLGGETILHDRDTIGRIWVEPVYFFEWITKG